MMMMGGGGQKKGIADDQNPNSPVHFHHEEACWPPPPPICQPQQAMTIVALQLIELSSSSDIPVDVGSAYSFQDVQVLFQVYVKPSEGESEGGGKRRVSRK